MRTRRKLVWIFIGCAIALVLLLTLFRERQPQFGGLSLNQWITMLDGSDPEISQQQAELAIRSIGTNGLPYYVKWFQYQERPWKTRLAAQAARLPGKFGDTAEDLVRGHGRQRQQAAFAALCILGPDAKPALPFLTQQLAGSPPWFAMTVIAHMGDVGLPTILTVLTNGSPTALRCCAIGTLGSYLKQFTDTNLVQSVITARLDDPDREVALSAAGVLCTHKIDQDRAMQVFAEVLQSTNRQLRQLAGGFLATNLRRSFSPAQIVQYLQDTNSPLSECAADTLGQIAEINPKLPENVLPALTNSLSDPRPAVRRNAAAALVYFKSAAEAIAPALLDAWNDPDQSVRRAATNSFFELPAYNILRNADALTQLAPGMSEEQRAMYIKRYWIDPKRPTSLTQFLDNPDPRIREMATNAFQKLKSSIDGNQTAENPSR
jgi:hypothetical protein